MWREGRGDGRWGRTNCLAVSDERTSSGHMDSEWGGGGWRISGSPLLNLRQAAVGHGRGDGSDGSAQRSHGRAHVAGRVRLLKVAQGERQRARVGDASGEEKKSG